MVLDVARQSENFRCMAEWAAGACERETARCMADLPYRAYVVVDITLLARDSGSIKNKVGRIAPFKHASTARVSICMRHFFHRKAVDKPACSAGCQCSMMHETALASASSTKHSSLSSLPSTPPPQVASHFVPSYPTWRRSTADLYPAPLSACDIAPPSSRLPAGLNPPRHDATNKTLYPILCTLYASTTLLQPLLPFSPLHNLERHDIIATSTLSSISHHRGRSKLAVPGRCLLQIWDSRNSKS